MRVIRYEKRQVKTFQGYMIANAELEDDPDGFISRDNIYAEGLTMQIKSLYLKEGCRAELFDVCQKSIDHNEETEYAKADFLIACRDLLWGETSEWKIAAVEISETDLSINIVNSRLYEIWDAQPKDHYIPVIYRGYIEFNIKDIDGIDLSFSLSEENIIQKYDVSFRKNHFRITEHEKRKKRELDFTFKKERYEEELKAFMEETEWIF